MPGGRAARLVAVALTAACSAGTTLSTSDPEIEAIRTYAREVSGDDLTVGRLRVRVSDISSDGRVARVRGKVTNTYDVPVAGIRYQVELYSAAGERVLDVYRREVDTTLAAGQTRRVVLDVSSQYLSAAPIAFEVVATPVRLDGKPFPPPPGWTR